MVLYVLFFLTLQRELANQTHDVIVNFSKILTAAGTIILQHFSDIFSLDLWPRKSV